MDSADAATPLGAWAWIRGYFTPATLFLVVNLVIGTIALTSRAATQQRRRREEHYYHDDAHGHGHHIQEEPLHPQMQQQPGYGHYYHPDQTLYAAPPPPAPAPLARTSSVLDRLRSFGLYHFRSGDFPPEYGAAAAVAAAPNYVQDVSAPVEEEETTATAQYASSGSEPAPAALEDERRPAPPRVKKSGSEVRKSQVARAVPRVVAAVAEDDHSVEARAEESVGGFRRGPSPLQQEYHYQEEYVPPVRAPVASAPAPLQRTPSVLDRLRSFSLYGFLAADQPAAASVPASDGLATPADENRHAHAHYDRSRSEPAPEQQAGKKKKPPEAKSRMAKSSSEARKTPAPRLAEAGGECVNARAEAFIDSFRQQQQEVVVHHYEEEEEYVPPPAPLSRTSSVLNRLRSFSLYRFRSGDLGPDLPETDEKEKQQQQQAAAQYGRSRSEPAREQSKKKQQQARMSKSSSSSVVEEEAETEQCVDARADDFINRFRQQLQLQRLNSLLNYKEMLGGGKQA